MSYYNCVVLMQKSFREWRRVTQTIIDESSQIFSSSLNSRSQSCETRSFSSSMTSFSCDYHGMAHSTKSHELDDHEAYEPTPDSGLGLVKDLLSGCTSPLFPTQFQIPMSIVTSSLAMATTQLDGALKETEASDSASFINNDTMISADCLHDHTTDSEVGRLTQDHDAIGDNVLLSLMSAPQCIFDQGDKQDQPNHCLAVDGVGSIFQNDDDDDRSLSVSDLTTQREVFAVDICSDQSSDNQIVSPSSPLVPSGIQALRPRYLHDALKQSRF